MGNQCLWRGGGEGAGYAALSTFEPQCTEYERKTKALLLVFLCEMTHVNNAVFHKYHFTTLL